MKYLIILSCALFLLQSCAETRSTVTITIANPLSLERKNEIIEIDFTAIQQKLSLQHNETIVVLNANGIEIPYQVLSDGKTLIFPTTVAPNGSAVYRIKVGTPKEFTPRTFGRFVPERLDDFAWENDRIAFRMFGQRAPGTPSSGVDMWLKRTENLIVDRWYEQHIAGTASLHIDHGEGLDCYTVGFSLGVGGIAPFVDDILWITGPYHRYRVIERGVLRTKFTLYYDEVIIGFPDGYCVPTPHRTLTAAITISLDAGSQLNRASIVYSGEGADGMSVAPGLFLHPYDNINARNAPVAERRLLKEPGLIAMAADAISNYYVHSGRAFMGVIAPTASEIIVHKGTCIPGDHLLLVGTHYAAQPFVYHFGGGWDKWGFETDEDWFAYMRDAQRKIENPLSVVSMTVVRR